MWLSSNSLIRERLVTSGRPAHIGAKRRDPAIGPFPVDPGAKLHQCVRQVDDLIKPGAKQIAFSVSGFFGRIVSRCCPQRNYECRLERVLRMNLQAFDASLFEDLQSKKRSGWQRPTLNGFAGFSGRHLDGHIAYAGVIADRSSECRRACRLRREIHPIFRRRLPTDTGAQSRRRKLASA